MDPYNRTTAYNGVGRSAIDKPTESSSPIRDRISGAESSLSDLHMAVDNLENRLDTLLMPVPPQPVSATVAPPQPQRPQSHVQGRLEILNDGLAHLCSRLNALHGRIEL